MPSKQNIGKINAWKAENVDRIVIQPRKEKRLPERLQAAVSRGKASSKQEYIITAIEEALKRDEIPIGESGKKSE